MLVNVQLVEGGPITQMDDALLEKREGRDNFYGPDGTTLYNYAEWVEYYVKPYRSGDRLVHRSSHVTITPEGMPPKIGTVIGKMSA